MTTNITVKHARPKELDVVMDILNDAARWLHERGIQQWPYPLPASEWASMPQHISNGQVYLARLPDGRAVGTLRIKWTDTGLWGDKTGIAGYIHNFAIHDSVRGQGVGAAMLEWAKGHIRAEGKQFLRLDCVADNPALNDYYRKAGLQYRGQVRFFEYVASLFEAEV